VACFDLVILDLDGTLYCSSPTTLGAVQHAVRDLNERHGLSVSVPDDKTILSGVGRTRPEFVRAVFPELSERYYDDMDELVWKWENALIERGHGSLYPGTAEALTGIVEAGHRLAVATNAGTAYMDHILDAFELRSFFDDIRCAGCEGTSDKADLIRTILRNLAVRPEKAVMVGDRGSDIDAAARAGTASIGCTWGFGSESELQGADRIARAVSELPPILASWEDDAP